jgi:hypothetical protein
VRSVVYSRQGRVETKTNRCGHPSLSDDRYAAFAEDVLNITDAKSWIGEPTEWMRCRPRVQSRDAVDEGSSMDQGASRAGVSGTARSEGHRSVESADGDDQPRPFVRRPRVSLTYSAPTLAGKTTDHTDTYHGHFTKLIPNEQVVEVSEFETTDPSMKGKMTITISLADANGGTDLIAVHEDLPPGVPIADNELGWREALHKLAAFVEAE